MNRTVKIFLIYLTFSSSYFGETENEATYFSYKTWAIRQSREH